MSGHVSALPAEFDRLANGRFELSPWPLGELAAAGIELSQGSEGRPELGTDPVAIAEATARLSAAGLLPDQAAPSTDPRRVELAFLARKYAGAPGAAAATLTTDNGWDGAGARIVHLDLFPARTSAGELVLGSLLIDPERPVALAAVTTPLAMAESIVAHVLHHGSDPGDVLEFGSFIFLAMHTKTFGGLTTTLHDVHLWKSSNLFEVRREHGLRAGATQKFEPTEFAPWLAELIVETVS